MRRGIDIDGLAVSASTASGRAYAASERNLQWACLGMARALHVGEVTGGIGKDHRAHRLVVADVAGAAAQMPIERLGDCRLEIAARHRLAFQALEQDLGLVEEPGGAIAALKSEMTR